MERVGKEKDTRGKGKMRKMVVVFLLVASTTPIPFTIHTNQSFLHCPWTVCSVHNHSHIFFFLFFFVPVVNINTVLADGINTQ